MPLNYRDIENGIVGFTQKDYKVKRHAHFPIEVALALSGRLHIETPTCSYSHIQSAIINSNVPHTFDCRYSECQLYFVDPTSYAGNHISKRYLSRGQDMVSIRPSEVAYIRDKYLFDTETSGFLLQGIDERIQCCMDWIKENCSASDISHSTLSKISFLSESRLAHLFKEQVGIPIRQYILWKKIMMAVKRYTEGFSLTDCAYFSGFADISHLNKTFKKMFGIYPSFTNQK